MARNLKKGSNLTQTLSKGEGFIINSINKKSDELSSLFLFIKVLSFGEDLGEVLPVLDQNTFNDQGCIFTAVCSSFHGCKNIGVFN